MPSFGDIINFLRVSLFGQTFVPDVDLTSKTIIITGANTGLGLDCAKHLIRLKVSNLILACRDTAKGEAAKASILAEAPGKTPTNIEVWQVDLDNYASVIAFGERVNTSLSRLDGFIANAGLELQKFEKSEDCERTLTVNVISTMLMAYTVLPKLQETSTAHHVQTNLSFVGSLIHVMAPHKQLSDALEDKRADIFAALSNATTADMRNRYPLSKLMIHLCFLGMVEQTKQQGLQGVTINCVNPGWCKTSLSRYRQTTGIEKICAVIFQRTSEQGSRTLVHGVVAGSETHGKYLSECQIKTMSSFVRSQSGGKVREQLSADLARRLDKIHPSVMKAAI